MDGPIAIIGAAGFIGRHVVERWPAAERARLRLLVRQPPPPWLDRCGAQVIRCDLGDGQKLAGAVAGSTVVINLLRPRGDGALPELVTGLISAIDQRTRRYIQCSSIDVYGRARAPCLDETTAPQPRNAYEREHLAAEQAALQAPCEVYILRLGAVFGLGGRNVISFIKEARAAPLWKLGLRRMLYGRRRMHLVSVERVAEVLMFLARHDGLLGGTPGRGVVLVTDDEAPENNFAFLQDALMRACGRAPLDWIPELPAAALRLALHLRGHSNVDPNRRFSGDKLRSAGFSSPSAFRERLEVYLDAATRAAEQGLA